MSSPMQKSTITHPGPNKSCFDNTNNLIVARHRLLEERCEDGRSAGIRNRVDESTGRLLPTVPPTSPLQLAEVSLRYSLRSASRSSQRARVGSAARSAHLLPSEPADLLKKKLKEKVVGCHRLQRQEEAGEVHPRHAMSTLHALMLKGNKQAQAEYFQRRGEEKQAKSSVVKESDL
jgi:hypothetical protein